jgi:cyclopropane fatty-acyl-phospholipid synthase-like methyltransferase
MILADKLRHNISFRMMALQFHLRDISEPPERILAEIGIMQGMTVLDFGCGPGSFSLAAARLTGHMGKVYAMDIDVHAINCVDKAAKHHGVENIQMKPWEIFQPEQSTW